MVTLATVTRQDLAALAGASPRTCRRVVGPAAGASAGWPAALLKPMLLTALDLLVSLPPLQMGKVLTTQPCSPSTYTTTSTSSQMLCLPRGPAARRHALRTLHAGRAAALPALHPRRVDRVDCRLAARLLLYRVKALSALLGHHPAPADV